MIINLSKLGRSGTGMWNYSLRFIEAVSQLGRLDCIICPAMHAARFEKYNCDLIQVPDLISNSSQVGKLKPILWWLYSFILAYQVARYRSNHASNSKSMTLVSTTHHVLPFITNQIPTIHDVRPYFYPDSWLQKIYFRYVLPQVARRASRVITVSNHVRSQLASLFAIEQDRIDVVYNTVEVTDFQALASRDSRDILAVGASWAHKNVHAFLQQHAVWADRYRLKIVCAETEYTQELKHYVASTSLTESVMFLHNLSFDALRSELSHSWCLIYPSLDEGFGIPPLEAMASATPVIAADIPVLREVLADSAIFVQTDSEESWHSALASLEQHYDHYVAAGRQRCSVFSFANMKTMIESIVTDK